MFQRVMAAAGIYSDRGVEKRGKGRQFKKRSGFHSLRHTFVSELANADIPGDVRRQISGHNDEKIDERYTHLDLDTKRRALAHLRPLVYNVIDEATKLQLRANATLNTRLRARTLACAHRGGRGGSHRCKGGECLNW